ncbi:unnamed protein product [Arabidopsis thaliana]|uniref:Uncharacterized protein n=2 Tax=Arabidopsis thaliana TaxID=3702 RepID=Q9LJF6_ARATH|nr:uncharacterized protein AT3G26934 [Arabidopsis thaliana]AEE77244.1 hypothetical protein AT3G26934 [Arabidopsis thaliana]BAB01187.1 unnamed protein product [Arabidopsis thaliana]CAA0383820.1 unnamed protein product [Arabidopsis thaliana]|eukprot:NP_001078213.1 hypothetical protein AT3G26934 [Arabidopsis thaliana]
MGCGVSRPETDEGRQEGSRLGSIGKDSETADSFISDKEILEISTDSKSSKTNGENTTSSKEEENEWKDDGQEKGDELKHSPESPSFRIYCVFPRNPNDDIVDDLQRNKNISDENKEQKVKRQEAVGLKIRRRFNNVKKLLSPPTVPSSTANRI